MATLVNYIPGKSFLVIGIIHIDHRNSKLLFVEPVCDLSNCLFIGSSKVRALPLANGINVGGHYNCVFSSPLSSGLIANSPRRDCRRVL
jgi:hypothetical protein